MSEKEQETRDKPIHVAPSLTDDLKQALVRETDLVTLVRSAPRERLEAQTGAFRIRGALPVPRLMDPETTELRLLVLHVRPAAGDTWEIYAIDGLDGG